MAPENFGSPPGQPKKPLSNDDVLAKKPMEVVISQSYKMYIPEAVKAKLDLLSAGTVEWVQYYPPESGTGYYYMVASRGGVKGAEKVREAKTRSNATVSARVPMQVYEVTRPAKGRKERYPVEWDENSPYGPALKVSTKPVSNEPTEVRPRKKKAGEKKAAEVKPETATKSESTPKTEPAQAPDKAPEADGGNEQTA